MIEATTRKHADDPSPRRSLSASVWTKLSFTLHPPPASFIVALHPSLFSPCILHLFFLSVKHFGEGGEARQDNVSRNVCMCGPSASSPAQCTCFLYMQEGSWLAGMVALEARQQIRRPFGSQAFRVSKLAGPLAHRRVRSLNLQSFNPLILQPFNLSTLQSFNFVSLFLSFLIII